MTKLLKPKDVAPVLNISEREVRDLCASGELRAGKVRDRIWRIHPDDLEAYVRQLRGLAPTVKKVSA